MIPLDKESRFVSEPENMSSEPLRQDSEGNVLYS